MRPLKNPRLGRFKSYREEILQDCSSGKYAWIDTQIFDLMSHLKDDSLSHDVISYDS